MTAANFLELAPFFELGQEVEGFEGTDTSIRWKDILFVDRTEPCTTPVFYPLLLACFQADYKQLALQIALDALENTRFWTGYGGFELDFLTIIDPKFELFSNFGDLRLLVKSLGLQSRRIVYRDISEAENIASFLERNAKFLPVNMANEVSSSDSNLESRMLDCFRTRNFSMFFKDYLYSQGFSDSSGPAISCANYLQLFEQMSSNEIELCLKDDWRSFSLENWDSFAKEALDCQTIATLRDVCFSQGICIRALPPQQRAFVTAFSSEFRNRNVADDFIGYLDSCFKKYFNEPDIYYAPYISMCQSSGMGKSRVISEAAKSIPTLYMCLASRESTCYPRQSLEYMTELQAHAGKAKGDPLCLNVLRFVVALIATAVDEFLIIRNASVNKQAAPKLFWDRQVDTDPLGNATAKKFVQISREMTRFTTENELLTFCDKTLEKLINVQYLLLAFDESRSLLDVIDVDDSYFTIIRRNLRKIGERTRKIFAVFADTTSAVANFYPGRYADISGREPTKKPRSLFEPFYFLTNMDIFIPKLKAGENPFELRRLYSLGRHLWAGFVTNEGPKATWELAKTKILGGINITLASDLSFVLAIALLGVRVTLGVRVDGKLAELLPSKHLKVILAIADKREIVHTIYPSEPVVVQAVTYLMSMEHTRPEVLLGFLEAGLMQGLIDTGTVGEIVSQIIAVLARDAALYSNGVRVTEEYLTVSVENFLNYLYTDAVETLRSSDEIPKKHTRHTPDWGKHNEVVESILSADLSFSHFIEVHFSVTANELRSAYCRGLAFQARPNQSGYDLVIPYRFTTDITPFKALGHAPIRRSGRGIFPDNDSDFCVEPIPHSLHTSGPEKRKLLLGDESVEAIKTKVNSCWHLIEEDAVPVEEIGFILIQVRNREGDSTGDESCIDPYFSGILRKKEEVVPHLVIKQVLKSQEIAIEGIIDSNKPLRRCLIAHGIDQNSMPCLKSKTIVETLKRISLTSSSPLSVLGSIPERKKSSVLSPNSYILTGAPSLKHLKSSPDKDQK